MLRLVAWLEVLIGVLMIVTLAIHLLSSNGQIAFDLRTGVLVVLGTLGLGCGIGLLRFSTSAWRGSLTLQLLQTPVFWVGSVLYRPGLGLFIPLGLNLEPISTTAAVNEFSLGVDFMVSLSAAGGQQYVGINVAALACIAILLLNRPSTPE